MSARDVVGAALRALGSNRLRALLTVLGVIMGVASVVLLVSIGNGASRQVLGRISALGANLLFVSPVQRYGATLTLQDPALIRSAVPLPLTVYPVVSSGAGINYQGTVQGAPLEGVVAGFDRARADLPAQGRFIRRADVSTDAKVVDLGAALAQDLFAGQSAVGRSVFILGQSFRVIGVMTPKGASFGVNLDNVAFVPVTTAQQLLGTDQLSTLVVQAPSAADAALAQRLIGRLYTQRYQTPLAMSVQSEDSLLQAVDATRQTFSELLAGTASIALLVGGIGIMNIMLVSVTERTREIGVRKAVGARRDDILAQFLLEALLLSMAGGLLGIGVGFATVPLVPKLLPFKPIVSLPSVAIAFLFSAVVGVVFGFYPALRASSTYPVEALRSE